jgi:hypothetical protein
LPFFNYFQGKKEIMRKLTLSTLSILALSTMGFGQDQGKEIINEIKECACDEIIMTSGAFEKRYSPAWIESAELKDGFIVFSKGSQVHKWNPEKIVMVEKGGTYIHIYLEQVR